MGSVSAVAEAVVVSTRAGIMKSVVERIPSEPERMHELLERRLSRSAVAVGYTDLSETGVITEGGATSPAQIWTSPGPRFPAEHCIPSTPISSIPGDSRPKSGRVRLRYTAPQGAKL